MTLPKPKPEEVENFPHDNPFARIVAVKGAHGILLYVSEREPYMRPDGTLVDHIKHLGKIVDGRYYPMEEYRRLFKRNGQPIEAEKPEKENDKRAYKRSKPLTEHKKRKYPSPTTLKGFPKRGHPNARIIKVKDALYVVESTYDYDEKGHSREHRVILGRVINDNEFVTIEKYRQLMAGSGKSRTVHRRKTNKAED